MRLSRQTGTLTECDVRLPGLGFDIVSLGENAMKSGIHPSYEVVSVHCACGHIWETRSTKAGDIRLDICSECHPFFTGKQKLVDTAGRVERFQKRYGRTR